MELVRGDAFSRLLAACRDAETPVPLAIASAIVGGALDGLHAAHEAVDAMGRPLEIVHRDVSPHNLIVTFEGVVVSPVIVTVPEPGPHPETATGTVHVPLRT